MEEGSPFTIEIMVDPLNSTRFRWFICEGNQILLRSPHSYATLHEAEELATDALTRAMLRHLAKGL